MTGPELAFLAVSTYCLGMMWLFLLYAEVVR